MVSPGLKQAIYASGVQWNMFSFGMVLAYPASLIAELQRPGSDIPVDLATSSWLASIPGLSGLIPTVLLGPLMHYAGRKVANICLSVPLIIGWLMTYFAADCQSISMLLAGRFLQGLCLGAPYFICVCIGEFSAPTLRSYLLSIKPLCGVLGVTVTHALAFVLDWQHMALVGMIPPTMALLITLFWPDTPEWLVSRGRYDEARRIFEQLRGYSVEGEREIDQIIATDKAMRQRNIRNNGRFHVLRKFKSRVLWKPVAVLFFAVLVPITGGRHFIASYSAQLTEELSGDKTKGYLYTVIGDVIAVIAGIFSLYVTRVCNRRHLLFGTGFLGFGLLAAASALLFARTTNSSEF